MKRKAASEGVEEDSITKLDNSLITNLPVSDFSNKTGIVSLPENSYESLLELKLGYDNIFNFPSNGCFPSLKILQVIAEHPDCEFLNRLFRSCPVLEDLSMSGNLDQGDKHIFRISIPTLKRLHIDLYLKEELRFCADHKFIIQTPKLEYLFILDASLACFEIGNIPSLLKAEVTIGNSKYFNKVKAHRDRMTGILEGIRHAKDLTLVESTTAGLSCVFGDDLPTFPSLLRLELGIDHFFGWKLLPYFLRNSEILEFLVLERESRGILNDEVVASGLNPKDYFGWVPPEFAPYISPHLKEIKVRNLWRSKDEVEVVKYLLKNCTGLEKMSIEFDENAVEKELDQNMIERFPRGSNNCELEFINMFD